MTPEFKTLDFDSLKTIPLPDYDADAHKGDYGKLLIIAGSRRLPGAAILAARAALRSGCGTVRVAAPESVAVALGVAVPELMVLPLPETAAGTLARGALELLEKQYDVCQAAVIGPGLDEDEETDQLCYEVIAACPLPLVVDAQALSGFNEAVRDKMAFPAARLLTPHPAEMATLLDTSAVKVEDNREKAAAEYAEKHKVTVVLKGRHTLIAGDGHYFKNEAGTRGLGTAGSGDVLAGIAGGLLAQQMEAPLAAAWAVHIHALAGEAAEKDLGDDGLMAGDISQRVPGVLRYLRGHISPRKKDDETRTGLRSGFRQS